MRILPLMLLALTPGVLAADASGRWSSNDNVALSTAKAGSRFFLDVVVAKDGSFKGTWEQYTCFNYTGAYGIVTAYCQRDKKPLKASGRLDAKAAAGSIELEKLGKSSFKFKSAANQKGQPQLEIQLPGGWLKQGDPVLYEAVLNPK